MKNTNDKGRPAANGAALNVTASYPPTVTTQVEHVTRCRRCDHELTATASVERGIGPVCRHRESEVVA